MRVVTQVPAREATGQWQHMLNKVPEVTIYFWLIKVLCTTVGETASDYLATTLNLGLTITTCVTGALLIIALFVQFRARTYIPAIYWLAVVLISVVGTQITDTLTDRLGVSLETTTLVFSFVLALLFVIWYRIEHTLSIHSIVTTRRETFYWLTVLFTFALGTAAGDLTAEYFNLGYLVALFIFGGLIALITSAHYGFRRWFGIEHRHASRNAVLAFWLAYILTRPLGASMGDYLSQAQSNGGLGLGTTVTSAIFLGAILLLVMYLTISKTDETSQAVLQEEVQEDARR